ncbi:MAG TPA: hypothetical protein GXZ90_10120 [Clostridiales bacterium]|nr:hypothetical protein [Clostridiales bacterium]
MIKSEVLYNKEIWLDDTRSIKLKYILLENSIEILERDKNEKNFYDLSQASRLEEKVAGSYYGIEIEQESANRFDIDRIEGISYSKDEAIDIIYTLFEYDVTPISMVEIIDDIVTQKSLEW